MEENKRMYFRNYLANPLCAEMTIVRIMNNQIDSSATKTCIIDIGAGGLRFLSLLKLPVNPYVVLDFQTEIMHQLVNMPGIVVRKIEREDEINEYGVKFVMDEQQKSELSVLINSMSIRLRKHANTESCRLCTKDSLASCLKEMHHEGDKPEETTSA